MRIGLIGDLFDNSKMPFHQTFLSKGQTCRTHFINKPDELCDYIVSFGTLPQELPDWWKEYPKKKKIAILPENPLIYFPNESYIRQHGVLISPFLPRQIESILWIPSHGGVPWFYGVNYRIDTGLTHNPTSDSPRQLEYHAARLIPQKKKRLSFVTSTKSGLPGYNFRLSLASALKKRLGNEIDIFGFGHNPIPTKEIAIDPYHYTIAIENSFFPNYWTEKLADAYLGFTSPIYLGAPNIEEFFDYPINKLPVDSIDGAVDKVLTLIESDPDLLAIFGNRQKVMFRHNIFYLLEYLLCKL
jgi:hypothetical protein